jgi:putative flippase GtrA
MFSAVKKRVVSSQPLKFLLVGGGATTVQFGMLVLFVELGMMPPILASILGYITGAVVNYLLNYYFTFLSDGKHLPTALKFTAVVVSALGLNALVMYVSIELLNIYYLLAQVITTLLILAWNFTAHRYWTYKTSPQD